MARKQKKEELFGRIYNSDGDFVLKRPRPTAKDTVIKDLYHHLLSLSWPLFFLFYSSTFLLANLFFALFYAMLEPGSLSGVTQVDFLPRFEQSYFFSVQTLSTIGYGHIAPQTRAAHWMVTFQAMIGLIGISLGTGLVFARFARPRSRISFSQNIVVSHLNSEQCLMFRVANERFNQIVEAHVHVVLTISETTSEGEMFRRIYDLKLRRDNSPLFALSWTVIHVIDESSPLAARKWQDLVDGEAQVLVTLNGVDETLSQTIYARHAYHPQDMEWNKRFVDILSRHEDGQLEVHFDRFHQLEDIAES